MRTSAYDAPASLAALSASAARSSAKESAPGAASSGARSSVSVAESRRGPTIVAAAATAPDLRKSRRVVDMAPAWDGILATVRQGASQSYAPRRRSVALGHASHEFALSSGR